MLSFLHTKVFLENSPGLVLSTDLDVLNFFVILRNIFHVSISLPVFQRLNFFLKEKEFQKLIFLFISLNLLIIYLLMLVPHEAELCIPTRRVVPISGAQNV